MVTIFPGHSRGVTVTDAALSLCALGGCAIFSDQITSIGAETPSKVTAVILTPSGKSTGKRKYTKRPKDPKRDTSISFDEMSRLMRVYGPIKCLRNRSSKEPGKTVKAESIRRKFYRWFPDFNERFSKTEDGWFKPKAGHVEEMQYREDLRARDKKRIMAKMKVCRRAPMPSDAF
ncbi:hypothetical protein ACHAWF_002328 [Thalassiosira exigua]